MVDSICLTRALAHSDFGLSSVFRAGTGRRNAKGGGLQHPPSPQNVYLKNRKKVQTCFEEIFSRFHLPGAAFRVDLLDKLKFSKLPPTPPQKTLT